MPTNEVHLVGLPFCTAKGVRDLHPHVDHVLSLVLAVQVLGVHKARSFSPLSGSFIQVLSLVRYFISCKGYPTNSSTA